MRRAAFLMLPLLVISAIVLFEVRLDRRPVLSLTREQIHQGPSGRAAQVELDLGPGARPETLRATLDGEDVTSRFRFREGGARGHVEELRPGMHRLAVRVEDRDGGVHERELELPGPRRVEPADLTSELHETAREILIGELQRTRASAPPQRLAELGARAGDAIAALEHAALQARGAEGEAAELRDFIAELDSLDAETRRHFEEGRARLRKQGLEEKVARLAQVEAAVLAASGDLRAALGQASVGDLDALRAARAQLARLSRPPELPPAAPPRNEMPPPLPAGKTALDILREAAGAPLFGGAPPGDPAQLLEEPVLADRASAPERAVAFEVGTPRAHAQTTDPDLLPSTGVRFDLADPDDPIVAQAAELGHDPVAIYEFVRNEIDFELYSGMARGARATLLARSGNQADQAALLVALLRISGYKARFVLGDILVDVARGKRWLQTRSREGFERFLQIHGFAPVFSTDGGEEVAYLSDTFWVKALVPYGPDRGRRLDAPLRWVFLDPSFKTHATRPGIDLANVAFDFGLTGSGFLADIQLRTPLELYADSVRASLRTSQPDKTVEDMGVRGPIERETLGMLPPTLPYRPVQFHAEFADVAALPHVPLAVSPPSDVEPRDFLARRLVVELRQANGTSVAFHAEVRPADVSHRRISIGWKGASAADQTLIDVDCQGDLARCPNPAIVDVVPVLRDEGVEIQAGASSVVLGTSLRLYVANVDTLQFALCTATGDYLHVNPCFYNEQSPLTVGSRFVLAYDVGQASQPLLDARARRLVESYQTLGAAHPGQSNFPLTESERDALLGELLFIGQLRYGQSYAELETVIEDVDKYKLLTEGRGQAQSLVNVAYLSSTPVALVPAGLLIDIVYFAGVYGIDATESAARKDKAFQLLGYTGSTLEHQLWEELTQFEAVSTIKGLQWVQDNPSSGATVVTLSSPTASIPSALPASLRTRIQQELNAGRTVLVPTKAVTIGIWQGVVYLSQILGASPGATFAISTTGWAAGGLTAYNFPLIYAPPIITSRGADPFMIRALEPINVASGNLDHSALDLEIPTRGARPLRLERVYNSQLQEVGPFGFGWTHSYNLYLEAIDDDADGVAAEPADSDGVVSGVALTDAVGAVRRFRIVSGGLSGSFAAEPGNFDVLRYSAGGLELQERDGTRSRFAAFGGGAQLAARVRLLWIDDPNANRTTLDYSGSPLRLASVADPLGRLLSFSYDASGRITQVSDWSGRSWTYFYTGQDLTQVRNPLDGSAGRATWRYEYYTSQLHAANDHNLRRYEDANGNGMTFYYHQNDKAYKQVDDEGAATRLSYDVFRLETIEIDPLGSRKLYQYNANGTLKRIVRENGAVEDYVYHPTSRTLSSRSDAFGNATVYSYDAYGNVKTHRTPSGATTTHVFFHEENPAEPLNSPRFHRVVQRTDPRGTLFRYGYDAKGNLTLETVRMLVGASLQTVELRRHQYDAYGNRIKTIENLDTATPLVNEAVDRVTQTFFDARSFLPVRVVDALGQERTNVWDVDLGEPDRGLLRRALLERRAVWPDGEERAVELVTHYSYDLVGRRLLMAAPSGTSRGVTHDLAGRVTQEWVLARLSNGGLGWRITQHAYDRANRRIRSTDAEGGVSQLVYDARGKLVKTIDPTGHAVTREYDSLGELALEVDPSGAPRRFLRDAKGRVVEEIDPHGEATRFEYDVEDRLVSRIDPEGAETTFFHDLNGNVIGMKDARANAGLVGLNSSGHTETRVYDELDRLVSVRDALNGVSVFTLDLLGNATAIQDAKSQTTSQLFDRLGRLTRRTTPLGQSENFAYDSAGNLIWITDPKGQSVKLWYDWEELKVSARYSTGAEEVFGYDGFGDRILERSPALTTTTVYDALGRPLERSDSRFSDALRFTWDAAGRLSSQTDFDGGVTQYRYDEAGRLSAISTPERTQIERHYDRAGRLVSQFFSTGASASLSWTPAGRLEQLDHRAANGTLLWSRSYLYDPVGNRTLAQRQGGGVESYEYDALNRLKRAVYADLSEQRFDYDVVGNRSHTFDRGVDRWYFHDAANRLSKISPNAAGTSPVTSFSYDANGNRTGATNSDLSWTTYAWDAADRLVQVNSSTGGAWSFGYDALGQRVSQTAPEKSRRYAWAQGNRIAEYGASGSALLARFSYGPGLDDLVQVARGATLAHAHADGLGSLLGFSSSGGATLGSYEYDVFGKRRSASGSFENDLAFTGRELDSSGLHYVRARFYDPATGRFLNQDPIRFEGGLHFYAYAGNNPTTLTDPTGKVVPAIVFGTILGAGLGAYDAYAANPEAGFFTEDVLMAGLWGGVTGGFLGAGGAFVSAGARALVGAERAGTALGSFAQTVLRGERGADVLSGAVVGAGENALTQAFSDSPFDWADLGASTAAGALGGAAATAFDAWAPLGRVGHVDEAVQRYLGRSVPWETVQEYADEAVGALAGAGANVLIDTARGTLAPQPEVNLFVKRW